MKLAEFPLLESEVYQVRTLDVLPSPGWPSNSEARLLSTDDRRLWLAQGKDLLELEAGSGGKSFTALLQRPELSWLLLKQTRQGFQLQSTLPSAAQALLEPLQIAVDEQALTILERLGAPVKRSDVSAATKWLTEEFVIEGQNSWVAVLRDHQAGPGDWRLIGRSWRIDLIKEHSGHVMIRRAERLNSRSLDWTKLEGSVSFLDFSMASQLTNAAAQASLDQSVRSNGSYIDLWRKYSEQEWQRSQNAAAQLGVLSYDKVEEANDEGGVWRFHVGSEGLKHFMSKWKDLDTRGDLELSATPSHPDWGSLIDESSSSGNLSRDFRGQPDRPRDNSSTLLIKSNQRPPEQGYLSLSLTGDRMVQERRARARAAIESGRRLPQLRHLLQDLPLPSSRKDTHRALTPNALACFKHGRPTERQERAIKVALETPDIALIIGPPGTGKTQVIAALERRISELAESRSPQHQVLISSFQHDAVENALERTSVFGLPGIKVGQRGQGESAALIENWCAATHEKVSQVLEQHEAEHLQLKQLNRLHLAIAKLRHAMLTPAERYALLEQMLNNLTELASSGKGIRLPAGLRDDLQEYAAERAVARPAASYKKKDQILRKVRALRVTPASFADDGQARLADCITVCEWFGGMPEPLMVRLQGFSRFRFLSDETGSQLNDLRNELLDALLDYRPPVIRNCLDTRGKDLLHQVEQAISARLKGSRMGAAGVLERYRDAFMADPVRVRETVHEYAVVVGATCQQSASQPMADLKTINGINSEGISFNTVVVDEAARANPLDLFIPMSMAERRIILVGDHRQLPHLLEPEVEKEVAATHSLSEVQRDAYKESLFQRLWNQLKDRQERDGFSRIVMLDTQFRMHPVLGDFVSREFYEKEGMDKVKSGRDASDFIANIPGHENKVCCWINVPNGDGDRRESKNGGTSWQRKQEAKRVAEEAQRLLSKQDDVSLGIITFYSAQRDEIFKALEPTGITRFDQEEGEWSIAEEYRRTRNGEERLRIGTVDAFQGKEFDIVLLSVVRSSNRPLPVAGSEGFETAANGKYGHLRLSNRMNVAMSRQRALLIAVGDRGMAEGPGAAEAVPALTAFLNLCQGEHGHVC